MAAKEAWDGKVLAAYIGISWGRVHTPWRQAGLFTCDGQGAHGHNMRVRIAQCLNCPCQEVTYPVVTPEVAFTGDTAAEVFDSPGFEDALAAKLLIMEATFLEEEISREHAKVTTSHSCDIKDVLQIALQLALDVVSAECVSDLQGLSIAGSGAHAHGVTQLTLCRQEQPSQGLS